MYVYIYHMQMQMLSWMGEDTIFISARQSMIPGSDNCRCYYVLNIKVKRVENTIFFSHGKRNHAYLST